MKACFLSPGTFTLRAVVLPAVRRPRRWTSRPLFGECAEVVLRFSFFGLARRVAHPARSCLKPRPCWVWLAFHQWSVPPAKWSVFGWSVPLCTQIRISANLGGMVAPSGCGCIFGCTHEPAPEKASACLAATFVFFVFGSPVAVLLYSKTRQAAPLLHSQCCTAVVVFGFSAPDVVLFCCTPALPGTGISLSATSEPLRKCPSHVLGRP